MSFKNLHLCTNAKILDKLEKLKSEIKVTILNSKEEIEQFRIKYLGSKGIVKELMSEIKNISSDRRKEFGLCMNEFKQFAENKLNESNSNSPTTDNPAPTTKLKQDYTLAGFPHEIGARHPIHTTMEKMISIFEKIGFTVTEGQEIEDDWHNFTALNLPENHPARDMQDTFYVNKNPDWVLRTHTSSVQIRVMEQGQLPIRQIFPGRVFRNETISARAHCFFHQIEGLYIDEKVSFADLKQTLYYFVKEMFGNDVKVRFRPSYFPFTEPSAEMDINCFICNSKGCAVCKQTGWVEILGCGMVHPNVLTNCGIDTNKYNGFAWGIGVERTTMLLHGIKDIRIFSENDIRFLKQFKM